MLANVTIKWRTNVVEKKKTLRENNQKVELFGIVQNTEKTEKLNKKE